MDYTAPVKATFELQRETIKSTQEALHQDAEFQQEFNQALLDGLDGDDEAQQRVIDSQREAILDTLDEQLETIIEAHENIEDQSVDAAEEVAEQLEDLQKQVEPVSTELGGYTATECSPFGTSAWKRTTTGEFSS